MDVVEQVRQIWATLLDMPELAVDDDLGSHGLDSLLAIRGIAAMRRELGISVELGEVFEGRTVRALSTLAHHQGTAPGSAAPSKRRRVLSGQQSAMVDTFPDGRRDHFYVITDVLRVCGALDVSRLREASATVVRRHTALRMLVDESGAAAMIVEADDALVAETWALCDVTDPDLLRAELERPFDTSAQLPIRFLLSQLGPQEWLWGLAVHHLATDGWSQRLILEDVAAAYNGDVLRPPSDYWASLESNEARWHPAVWDSMLARKYPAMRALRPATGTGKSQTLERRVAGATAALQRVTAGVGCTPYHLFIVALLGAVGDVLHADEVIVGTPFAGRVHPASFETIGFFSNTLLIGVDLREHVDPRALVDEVMRLSRAAMAGLGRNWRQLLAPEDQEVFTIRAICHDEEALIGLPSLVDVHLTREPEPPADEANRPLTVALRFVGDSILLEATFRPDTIPRDVASAVLDRTQLRLTELCAAL